MINFILENFDTIFKNKTSLETLDKVILDLAIKGKLVEQNQDDEPASELIKRIKAEKQRLIDEKVIKKEKPLPPIEDEEIPFDIPNNWEWVRLGEISEINMGQSPKGESINSLNQGFGLIGGASDMGENYPVITRYTTVPTKLSKENDLILSIRATLGRPIFSDGIYCLGRGVCAINSSVLIRKFLKNFFLSREKELYTKATGTTFLQISKEDIRELLLPLPPIEEQKRIVSKVEKLQSIIKDLKEIYIKNQNNRENLKKSLLSEIESQSSDKDLLKNLEIIFANFDKIIKTKEDIKDIRNLILSLAIKGKLVEQNQDDEKASELLKRIKSEKQRLIDEKVIKKEKPLPPIEEEEIPFDIPNSWEWVRLGDISIISSGKTPKMEDIISNGEYPFYRISDMNKSENQLYMKKAENFVNNEYLKSLSKKGTIIFPKNGGAVFTNKRRILIEDSLVDLNTGTLYPLNDTLDYIFTWFKIIDLKKISKGTALPTVDNNILKSLPIPLLPIEEQKRIVSKVESLMKICDLLEEKITLNEKISENLLLSFIK